MTKKTLLIDGDIILYKAAFSAQTANPFQEDDVHHDYADLEEGKHIMTEMLDELAEKFKAEIVICLTDKENWRKELEPTYKQNRKKNWKPILLKPLKAHMEETYQCISKPRMEADDLLGILMTTKVIKGKKMCCSIDKDLLQIPGLHYNLDNKKILRVEPEEGRRLHWIQSLAGDVVDNYPGCPGIGMKGASKIIDEMMGVEKETYVLKSGPNAGEERERWVKVEMEDEWSVILSHYAKAGLDEEYAILQARLAHIITGEYWDGKKQEPILWTPPE